MSARIRSPHHSYALRDRKLRKLPAMINPNVHAADDEIRRTENYRRALSAETTRSSKRVASGDWHLTFLPRQTTFFSLPSIIFAISDSCAYNFCHCYSVKDEDLMTKRTHSRDRHCLDSHKSKVNCHRAVLLHSSWIFKFIPRELKFIR